MDIVTLSGVRKELLFYLDEGPRSLSEIREHLDTTSPEVSPRIKELIEHNMVRFEDKKYHLTPMGRSIINNFKPFYNTINVYDQYWEWWEEHDLSSIPDELINKIGEIKNFVIIEDDPSDMSRTKTEFSNIISHSHKVIGVSCVFDESFPDLFVKILKSQVPVSIVITDEVYNLFKNNYPNQLKEFLNDSNGAIYVSNIPIRISHIVTEDCLFFSLCYKNGKFDINSNIVSNDPSSMHWGIALFEYYRERAVKK